MNFPIEPWVGVGGVRFGMDRTAVREALNVPFKTFRRAPNSEESDLFPSLRLFAYYTQSGELEALEFGRPSVPTFNGQRLLDFSMAEAKAKLTGAVIDREGTGLRVNSEGMGLRFPAAETDDAARAESVIVFRAGYYDD